MGTNAALPLSSYLGTGFGIKHQYVYPQLEADASGVSYNYKEEETIITVPLAIGITPRLSFGINLNMHIDEYQLNETGKAPVEGNALSTGVMLGTLFQISQRFRMGVTCSAPASLKMSSRRKITAIFIMSSNRSPTACESERPCIRSGGCRFSATWNTKNIPIIRNSNRAFIWARSLPSMALCHCFHSCHASGCCLYTSVFHMNPSTGRPTHKWSIFQSGRATL